MHGEHDPVAFLRFAMRSGHVELAQRLTRTLRADPRYRERAEAVLQDLPPPGGSRHSTPGGRMLDTLLDRFAPTGQD